MNSQTSINHSHSKAHNNTKSKAHVNYGVIVKAIVNIILAMVIIWVIASFIDVNMHNMTDCQYSDWNLFSILFNRILP